MMKLNPAEEMLFALLRGGLQTDTVDATVFQGVTPQVWGDCYRLAAQQGVMAVAWDGVTQLPDHLQPPRGLKLTWGLAVQAYEERYRRYCRTVSELSGLYAAHGITTVQLKGVGLSVCYPVPEHREGGDIDIYTCSADLSRLSNGEAHARADELMRQQGIGVDTENPKHSNFYYRGVPVENHRTFVSAYRYDSAARIDLLLKQLLQPQPVLLDGKYEILTPSAAFNTVFIAFHAAQHYGYGLALHHLCDWACLMRKHGLRIPEGVTDRRFLNTIHALTELCNRHLGTSISVPAAYAGLAENMLEDMLRPPYAMTVPVQGRWNILVYKTRRFLYRYRRTDSVIGLSLAQGLWMSIVRHVSKPQTIFQTDGK